MAYSYYLGLDLGQAADYSALAMLEVPIWNAIAGDWTSYTALPHEVKADYSWEHWQDHAPTKPPLFLRTLHRYPLRTPYPAIVGDVIRRLGGPDVYRRDAVLVVDGTGVGAAVVDMFRHGRVPCFMDDIIITGGTKAKGSHVPKRDLIGAVQVLLQSDRLKVAGRSEHTETWKKEMQSYRIRVTDAGNDTYDARRDSDHDDLVLAVALACWYRYRWTWGG